MANLSIRKLDDKVYEQLRMRSLQHSISMEEEVRQIITQAVAAPDKIGDVFKNFFGKKNGVDLTLEIRRDMPHLPIDLNSDSD